MTTQTETDKELAYYRLGFQTALQSCEALAREDRRVDLAKGCGYVPAWQKGRWTVADELAARLKVIEEAANGEPLNTKES